MSIPLSTHLAAGTVIALTPAEEAEFPRGTIITRDKRGVLTANVSVGNADGDRDKIAHVTGVPYGSIDDLALRVREHFPPPEIAP